MKLEIQQADLQNAALINSSNLLAWGPNAFLLAYECSMIHQFGKTYVVAHLGMYIGTRESTTRIVLTSLKFTLEEWKDVTHAPAVHSDNCR